MAPRGHDTEVGDDDEERRGEGDGGSDEDKERGMGAVSAHCHIQRRCRGVEEHEGREGGERKFGPLTEGLRPGTARRSAERQTMRLWGAGEWGGVDESAGATGAAGEERGPWDDAMDKGQGIAALRQLEGSVRCAPSWCA